MKRLKRIISIVLCVSVVSFYNHIYHVEASGYGLTNLTTEEILLYASHPSEAAAVKICAGKAESFAAEHYKKYTLQQGNGDACRHAYWSALMTRDISKSFAYDVGLAHEGLKRGYSFSALNADAKMDVSNNYFGRTLGSSMKGSTDIQLAYAVVDNVNGGKLKRIRTYTSKSSENDRKIDGVMTKYVGYYVATTSGGYISSSTK